MALIFWGILSMGMLAVGVCTVLGFLERFWWVFDLFNHFRLQYFYLLSALLLIFLVGGQSIQAIICAALALLNLGLILMIYRKVTPHFQAGKPTLGAKSRKLPGLPTYRVLLANVLQKNREYHRVRQLIESADPDLILLIEINPTWVEKLQPTLEKYPYSVKPLRQDNYGLGLFSKIPFDSSETMFFGDAKVPSVTARINLDGHHFTIIGTHPPPPKTKKLADLRDIQLMEIARFIAGLNSPVILLGDLNNSSWSPHFQQTLRVGRLKDSRQGWSLQPSWPVDRPLLMVPIDHILVTEGFAIHRRWRGPYTGSDHFPILADFSLETI